MTKIKPQLEQIHISETLLSDAHKDAFGFRPRNAYKEFWTKKELETEYLRLEAIMLENEKQEEEAQANRLKRFKAEIQQMEDHGAASPLDAIVWIMEAQGELPRHSQAIEHFFWHYGLSIKKIDEYSTLMKLWIQTDTTGRFANFNN